MANSNKVKGSNLERQTRLDLLKYWPKIKTSRLGSKLMDDSGIDLINLPINIQCKAGYNKNRPRYEELYQATKELLTRDFMANDPVHNYPYVIVHKVNTTKKKAPEYKQVIMTYEFFLKLIEAAHDKI